VPIAILAQLIVISTIICSLEVIVDIGKGYTP